jgi:antigen flippase
VNATRNGAGEEPTQSPRRTLVSAAASLISLLCALGAAKILAVSLGPAGIGLFSVLRQAQQTGVAVATLNAQGIVVQGIARRSIEERAGYLWTLGILHGGLAALAVLLLLLLAPLLAQLLVPALPDGVEAIRYLGVAVATGVVVSFGASVLNGYRATVRLALVQVTPFLAMVAIALPALSFGPPGLVTPVGAMLVGSSTAGAVAALFLARRLLTPVARAPGRSFDLAALVEFGTSSVLMLGAGLGTLGVQLAVRALVVRQLDLEAAGLLESAWALASVFPRVLQAAFAADYFPALSAVGRTAQRAAVMRNLATFVLPPVIAILVVLIVFKGTLLELLYAENFSSAINVARWFLLASYFRITGLVLSFAILSAAEPRIYALTELLWASVFLVGSLIALVVAGSLEAVGVAFLVAYVTYCGALVVLVGHRLQVDVRLLPIVLWLAGLVLVSLASALTWSEVAVQWWGIAMLAASIAVWLRMTIVERGLTARVER